MSERDNIECIVATIDGLQEVVISAGGSAEHLQLVFANDITPQRSIYFMLILVYVIVD